MLKFILYKVKSVLDLNKKKISFKLRKFEIYVYIIISI